MRADGGRADGRADGRANCGRADGDRIIDIRLVGDIPR